MLGWLGYRAEVVRTAKIDRFVWVAELAWAVELLGS